MENNLRTVVDNIEAIIKSVDKTVGDFYYGDIYNINHYQSIKYPAVILTNATHFAGLETVTYYFNIFYIDRLTEDKSNKLDVQSTAISTLTNALQLIDDQYIVIDNYEIHTFEEKFNDVCAGAYAKVGIKCAIQPCDAVTME